MKEISIGLRLGTMLLDHAIICFIGIPPVAFYNFLTASDHAQEPMSPYLMIPLFVIYFCKDCIGGRSPAKRILKLALIDNKTNLSANPLQLLVRNFFVIVWPIEVVVALFNQQRRIGDFVAGTKLTIYTSKAGRQSNRLQIVVALLLATVFTYFLIKVFTNF